MKRCFIALRIDVASRRRLGEVAKELRALPKSSARKIRPVKPENLHVTLQFLGPTTEPQIPDLLAVLGEVAQDVAAVTGRIVGLGAFPSRGRPRIVWAGLGEGRAPITELAVRIEEACEIVGFERDGRAKHPHVTIARVEGAKSGGLLTDLLESYASEAFGSVEGESIVLFESELGRGGSIYTPLRELRLGGPQP